MGKRGEGYVIIQFLLFGLIAFGLGVTLMEDDSINGILALIGAAR